MTNKDLLKEAIAEAKTIREAAIANAKEALEETLTPHLREMLAQKLQEMEELEETDNNGTNSQVDSEPTDIDHGNIVNEEDEEEEEVEDAEVEDTEEEGEDEDLDPNDPDFEDKLRSFIRDTVAQEAGVQAPVEDVPGEEGLEDMEDDNTIDIDELLAELEGLDEESGYGEVKKTPGKVNHAYTRKPGSKRDDLSGVEGDGLKEEETEDEGIYEAKKKAETAKKKADEAEKELKEAMDTIQTLRGQLQEVNLLNAKLLYVNKVFKSNNLSEGQKVNVIAAFDKAETVREVKLVFETVSKNVVTKKPTSIKEHTSFASKATGNATTTAPKEIISEVSDQVKRMQFLAGIIK
jgi:hypothetical protein